MMAKFSAANSKQLLAAVDRFNATNPDNPLRVYWGRQSGSASLWYAHRAHGGTIKNNLRFSEVVTYVNDALDDRAHGWLLR